VEIKIGVVESARELLVNSDLSPVEIGASDSRKVGFA
jgi:hypothetical protein